MKNALIKTSTEISFYIIDNWIYKELPRPTLEDVIQKAYKVKYCGRGTAMQFARNASEDDLKKLVEMALSESNLKIKADLLWAFRKTKYKFSDETLQDLVQSENEDIRDTAYYIMGQTPSEKMHDVALSIISDGKELENGIELLCRNFKKEDEKFLFDATKKVRVNKRSLWHGAYMAIETAFDKGRWKPQTDILKYVYENTLCSCCRWRIVKLMNQHKILTKQIMNECLFDSNNDIRVFAERKLKS